jgi:hypothetical protein
MSRRKINWDEIDNKIEESKKPAFVNDDGYAENLYEVKTNDKGKFEAVLRFLPRPEGDGSGVPYVELCYHGFKDVGGWFIENCPTTPSIKGECPACKANSVLWKTGTEANKNICRARGRRKSYFSNVLVVSDPQNKANEGKVFIFRFGKTVFDMFMEKVSPDADSVEEKVRVYDYDEGLNFKLKIKPKNTGKKSHNDYSSSTFVETITPVADTDDEIDAIDAQLHTLQQIVSKDKFKSFDVLQANFQSKIGEASISKPEPEPQATSDEDKSGNETVSTDQESPDSFFETLQKEDDLPF